LRKGFGTNKQQWEPLCSDNTMLSSSIVSLHTANIRFEEMWISKKGRDSSIVPRPVIFNQRELSTGKTE